MRYRKIDPRVWIDARFRGLTPMVPSGQGLWLYLLTCPMGTSLPGVIVAGPAALAEGLRWPVEAFREAFREAFEEGSGKGMAKADFEAPLVWLVNGTKYNHPESPNVVRSWEDHWNNVPECVLKDEIWLALKAFTEGLGEAFAKAFVKACVKPSAKPCGKAMPNQEQYQEQYQEQEQEGEHEGEASLRDVVDATSTRPTVNQDSSERKSKAPSGEVLTLVPDGADDSGLKATDLAEAWNEYCAAPHELPKVTLPLNPARTRKVQLRIREHPDPEFWSTVFGRVGTSSLLRGGKGTWRATFDWLMDNATNVLKVHEGNYVD